MQVPRHTRRERRPQAARACRLARCRRLVAQQVHRVVLCHADQRESERQRDAVHGAEHHAHRCEPGEAGARERRRSEMQSVGRARVRHEPAARAWPARGRPERCEAFGGGARARLPSSTAKRRCPPYAIVTRLGRARCRTTLVERRQRRPLSRRVEAAARVSATSSARSPAASNQTSSSRRGSSTGCHCSSSVSNTKVGSRASSGSRAKPPGKARSRARALTRRVQAATVEGASAVVGRHYITVGQQPFGNRIDAELAVGHETELLVAAQRFRQCARCCGEHLGGRVLQADDEQARGWAFANDVEQQPFHGRFRRGEEQPQVGADVEPTLDEEAESCERGGPRSEQ